MSRFFKLSDYFLLHRFTRKRPDLRDVRLESEAWLNHIRKTVGQKRLMRLLDPNGANNMGPSEVSSIQSMGSGQRSSSGAARSKDGGVFNKKRRENRPFSLLEASRKDGEARREKDAARGRQDRKIGKPRGDFNLHPYDHDRTEYKFVFDDPFNPY